MKNRKRIEGRISSCKTIIRIRKSSRIRDEARHTIKILEWVLND